MKHFQFLIQFFENYSNEESSCQRIVKVSIQWFSLFQPLYLQLANKTDSKIDINDVRAFHMNSNHENTGKFGIDELKLFQTILSKQLLPERYNGHINLEYALGSLNATSEEIETSLVTCTVQT